MSTMKKGLLVVMVLCLPIFAVSEVTALPADPEKNVEPRGPVVTHTLEYQAFGSDSDSNSRFYSDTFPDLLRRPSFGRVFRDLANIMDVGLYQVTVTIDGKSDTRLIVGTHEKCSCGN